MHILLVESDPALSEFLRKGLELEHHAVDKAHDAERVYALTSQDRYDLAILDQSLPNCDWLSLLKDLRVSGAVSAVLMITGSSRTEDRVLALDSGADDVLMKPFSFSELAARVRALLRRKETRAGAVLKVANLQLDRMERKVERSGQAIDLTAKEFALLEYLMRNAGRSITRAMIVENVWNLSFETATNVVDVYINYLRKKVDHGFSPKLIHTVRGVGYELSENA